MLALPADRLTDRAHELLQPLPRRLLGPVVARHLVLDLLLLELAVLLILRGEALSPPGSSPAAPSKRPAPGAGTSAGRRARPGCRC